MLRNKARSAVIWSALDATLRQGGGFIVSIILARLLTPEDFGTVALLAIFIGVAGIFVNAGLGQALIQSQDVTHDDESTVFWFNLCAAIIVMLLLMLMAPWISDFFELPVLVPLTIVLAVNIVISAMGSIHSVLMSKNLNFKTPMKIGLATTVLSGAVGIYMAWTGYGLWALVGQSLSASILGTLLLWMLSSWRPLYKFNIDSFRRLFGFGGWIFADWLLDTFYHRGYTLLIGKFYSTYDLGIYNRADSTQQLPISTLTGLLSRVIFPILSSVNTDVTRLVRGMRLSIRSIMLVTTPVMLGLLVVAEPFVQTIFGDQWLPAVPILQVLCLGGFLWPVQVVNLIGLQAMGHARLQFRLGIIKKLTGIFLLIVGSFFGIMGIAWSRVAQAWIALIINTYYSKKILNYGIVDQLKDVFPTTIMGVVMALIVGGLPYYLDISGLMLLLVSVIMGSTVYLTLNFFFRAEAFQEALRLIRNGS